MTYNLRISIFLFTAECMIGACGLLSGCMGTQSTGGYQPRLNANPAAGRVLLQSYGCGSCHEIPGVPTANGMVGPPLFYFSRRTLIAGELPNTPDNLIRWIEDAPAIEPGTAMPDLDVPEDKAKDMAAYLYTLH